MDFRNGIISNNLRKTEGRRSLHQRKALMEELSDGFLALPGGYGTLDELFEILTWSQLGLHRKPIGLLNVAGYFDPLLAWVDRAVADGFIKAKYRQLLLVATDAAGLLDRLHEPPAPEPPTRWIGEKDL